MTIYLSTIKIIIQLYPLLDYLFIFLDKYYCCCCSWKLTVKSYDKSARCRILLEIVVEKIDRPMKNVENQWRIIAQVPCRKNWQKKIKIFQFRL